MTLVERIDRWQNAGWITVEQHRVLGALVTRERVSLYLELNGLMYLGVASIAGGIGWVARRYFDRIGDGAIIAALVLIIGFCLYYAFTRATAYSNDETESPAMAFDYVIYLGCLVFGALVGYLQFRFPPPLTPEPEYPFLISAAVYSVLAYRFDNRFVLSLAFTALAGAFGLTLTKWGYGTAGPLINSSLAFAALLATAGALLYHAGIKRHFLGTYLHLSALTALVALLVGFEQPVYMLALIGLSLTIAAIGFRRRRAWFVSYGVVFAYLGISIQVLRNVDDVTLGLLYMLVSGLAVVGALVVIARQLVREP